MGTSGVRATATTTNNCTAQDALNKGDTGKVISNDQGTCDVADNSTSNPTYGNIAFSVAAGGTTDLVDLATPMPTDAPPPAPSPTDAPPPSPTPSDGPSPTPDPTPTAEPTSSDGPSPSPTGRVLGTSTSTPDTGAGSGTMFGTGIALLVLGFGLVFGIPRKRNKSNL